MARSRRRNRLTGMCARRDSSCEHPHTRSLLFLAPGDVAKGRVEPISWMRTCDAYAELGMSVTLATLRINRADAIPVDEVWRHFGVERRFRLLVFRTRLHQHSSMRAFRLWGGRVGTRLALNFGRAALQSAAPVVIVHARSPVMLAPFVALRRLMPRRSRLLLVLETHAPPPAANGWIVTSCDLVVVNSERLADEVRSRFRLAPARVLHAPLPPFNPLTRPISRSTARASLGLDANAAIACYSGKMTREHNEFLLKTAGDVARRIEGFQMLLVGGNPTILEWTRARTRDLALDDVIILAGFVPPAKVGAYQAAADVLVYHMPETVEIFPYTTPAKGYEYQAMERPIVATDFPLFSEVFGKDGERAIRVVDRTPAGFATGICRALDLGDAERAMTNRAAEFVRERTWSRRSVAILDALGV